MALSNTKSPAKVTANCLRKMNNLKLDLDALEVELLDMMSEDDLYWRRNKAKFKAVQQASDYRQFRDLVETSHLKPMTAKEMSADNKATWNRVSDPQNDQKRKSIGVNPAKNEKRSIASKEPQAQKPRNWTHLTNRLKENDRLEVDEVLLLGMLMKNRELSERELGLILKFVQNESKDEAKIDPCIKEAWLALNQTKRFGLKVLFLNEEEQEILKRMQNVMNK